MSSITARQSVDTENRENKLAANGSYSQNTVSIVNGVVYQGDGRTMPLRKADILCNIEAYQKAQVYGASGETDKQNSLNIYGDAYYQAYNGYSKIAKLLEANPYLTPHQVTLSGAAGEEAITGYETVRKNATILGTISGQQRIEQDLNAINMAEITNTTDFKVEFIRKTSAVNNADVEIADDQMPSDIRSVFAVGTHELFADATSYQTSLRDKELKVDISAEIQKEIPLMFVQTKETKMITHINADPTLLNQGDWSAVTGNFFDVDAAADVQAAEDAVKAYGGTLVAIFNSDSWRPYENNLGSAFDGRAGNISTNTPSVKTGTLKGNPSVSYFINDSVDTETYVLAAKESWLKFIQGMVINTTFTDSRTAGQTQWTFHFDFNGVFENEGDAVSGGSSVVT